MRIAILALLAVLAVAAGAGAQFERTVGVTGTTVAGTDFSMLIVAGALSRQIDFPVDLITVDYSPVAMAQLMVDMINEDFAKVDPNGFTAFNAMKADGRTKFDATFVIRGPNPFTEIKVGVYGMPNTPALRPPGVGFNPNLSDWQADANGIPFRRATANSPTASFTINGQDPSLEFDHRIEVPVGPAALGNFSFQFSSGPNPGVGFMIARGPFGHAVFDPASGPFPANLGGTVDIGIPNPVNGAPPTGLAIIADGIFQGASGFDSFCVTNNANPAVQVFTLTAPLIFAGQNFGEAFQAIFLDPTNAPLFLTLSAAVQPVYEVGFDQTVPIPSDGFMTVNFDPAGAAPVLYNHYGVIYPGLTVAENGYLVFGAPVAVGPNVDPIGANNAAPAIFVNWANWDLSQSGGIDLFRFGTEFRVRWGRPGAPARHFGDNDAGIFEAALRLQTTGLPNPDANSVMMHYVLLSPLAANDNDAVAGITPGQGIDPSPVSRNLSRLAFSDSPSASLLMQNRFSTVGPVTSQLQVNGATQVYHNGSQWNARTLGFFPPTGGPGVNANLYHSIASSDNPNDLRRAFSQFLPTPQSFILRNPGPGGQTLFLAGYFRYLFRAGFSPVVLLDPLAQFGAPQPLQILGVMENPPPPTIPPASPSPQPVLPGFRDFEGLVIRNVLQLPSSIPSGASISIGVLFQAPTGLLILPNALTVL